LSPTERAIVLCVDEKSQCSARRTQTAVAEGGPAGRAAHARLQAHGTTSLFAALDVKAGTIVGKCMAEHDLFGKPVSTFPDHAL